MEDREGLVAGIDVGTECVKVVIMDPEKKVLGRSVVPSRGYFEDCVSEAMSAALDDAKVAKSDLVRSCATGFGARRVTDASMTLSVTACHSLGAFHHFAQPMTVVDIGGRDPSVIQVDEQGYRCENRSVRRCAVGIGNFLMFAARHLDVHPTRLEELAASVETPATIGSYCSVFAGSEILERLVEGSTREEVASGCIQSVAERVFEIGDFKDPLVITGGVAEYFPGVITALARLTGIKPQILPEPISAGAMGAALRALGVTQAPAAGQAG